MKGPHFNHDFPFPTDRSFGFAQEYNHLLLPSTNVSLQPKARTDPKPPLLCWSTIISIGAIEEGRAGAATAAVVSGICVDLRRSGGQKTATRSSERSSGGHRSHPTAEVEGIRPHAGEGVSKNSMSSTCFLERIPRIAHYTHESKVRFSFCRDRDRLARPIPTGAHRLWSQLTYIVDTKAPVHISSCHCPHFYLLRSIFCVRYP